MSQKLQSFFSVNFFLCLFLGLAAFLVYLNILPNQLFFDDEELIYKNIYIQNFRFFPKYFTENMIAGAGKQSNMYRPLLLVSFAWDYFMGRGNPSMFHLTSIILHTANTVLLFLFFKRISKNRLLAFLTSLFFAVHPIQTEAVAYASGRTDLLYSFFVILALIVFLKLRKGFSLINYLTSLLLFILALLSKETAVIFPALLVLTFLWLEKEKWKSETILLIPFFLIDIFYVYLRLTLLNFVNILNFYSQPNPYSQNLLIRVYTFTRAFFEYLAILFFPKDLIFARRVDPIVSFFNPWVIIFLLTLTLIFCLIKFFFSKNKIFLFALFWFFATLLPASGIIPINNIIAEHYLYLPSFGFFLLISFGFIFLLGREKKAQIKSLEVIILTLIIFLLSLRTVIRNFDFKNSLVFYQKSLAQSPWHLPLRHNLAMAYAENGDLDRAIFEYKNLINLADVYPNTHHNLANAYEQKGMYKEAEKEYLKALQMDPHFYFSLSGLANLYRKTGEKEKLENINKKIQDLKIK